jgi:hypothetical protein
MTQEEFDVLNGRVLAMSITLSAVIQTLPALSAAQAALTVKIEQQAMSQEDAKAGASAAEVQARDAILDSFAELLSTVAQSA